MEDGTEDVGSRYPRVLFVTPHAFNKVTGTGITFSNLFRGWPIDRLATAHDDPVPVTEDVCTIYYRLAATEIKRWGSQVRPSSRKPVNNSSLVDKDIRNRPGIQRLKRLVFGDSMPQRGNLTPELEAWISEFKPDVLFTILGSNGLMELVRLIQHRFDIPLVVHFMDDWSSVYFRKGFLAGFQRRQMETCIDHLVSSACARLGICEAMCEEYSERYKVSFESIQNAVDIDAARPSDPDDIAANRPARIVYAGSILTNAQSESLADCCCAVAEINRQNHPVRMEVYSPDFLAEPFRDRLEIDPCVQLLPPLTEDKQFFQTIGKADVLLMPVNFDEHSRRFIRLSMPTRVPAYLASGTPILVYGPNDAAQVKYAKEQGWGYVVEQRSLPALIEGLKRIITDVELRRSVSNAALLTAREYHDIAPIRKRFQTILRTAAGQKA